MTPYCCGATAWRSKSGDENLLSRLAGSQPPFADAAPSVMELEEIGGRRWSEVDFAKGLIKLGPERTKNKSRHEIPLSGMAKSILEGRAKGETSLAASWQKADEAFVFGRFTSWSKAKAALDQRCAIAPWTIRRTCATGLGNLRVSPHVIEQILNHRSGHKAGVAPAGHAALPASRSPASRSTSSGIRVWECCSTH
jgi:integrase